MNDRQLARILRLLTATNNRLRRGFLIANAYVSGKSPVRIVPAVTTLAGRFR